MSHRKGETHGRAYFRADRIVQINGKWFFLTRENQEPLGPFGTYETTVREAKAYIRDLEKFSNPSLMYRPRR